MYILADGVAQFGGLLFGERAGDGAPLLKADDGDAAVHLEVEGESAAVLQLEDERGRDSARALSLKWHLCKPSPPVLGNSLPRAGARRRPRHLNRVGAAPRS